MCCFCYCCYYVNLLFLFALFILLLIFVIVVAFVTTSYYSYWHNALLLLFAVDGLLRWGEEEEERKPLNCDCFISTANWVVTGLYLLLTEPRLCSVLSRLSAQRGDWSLHRELGRPWRRYSCSCWRWWQRGAESGATTTTLGGRAHDWGGVSARGDGCGKRPFLRRF